MKNNVRYLATAVSAVFIILAVYLTYIQAVAGEGLYLNPLNPRLVLLEKNIQRGTIYDRYGQTIARTVGTEGHFQRQYPYGSATAQTVGYVSERYGSSGLEASYAGHLLGFTGAQRFFNEGQRLMGQTARGNDLILTLDVQLQQLAVKLLSGRRGAVVALEPATGAVLVLASSPTFDPNRLQENWQGINTPESGSPLLNRAIQGLYPPGSIMKLVTAIAALEDDLGIVKKQFYCPGYLEIEGRKLTCPRAHGHIDFQEAMMYSCNVTFANLALGAGKGKFKQAAELFGFNRVPDFELNVVESQIPDSFDDNTLVESCIGQGAVLASPLQMALVTAAVANKGIMMQPYLVDKISSATGRILQQVQPKPLQITAGTEVVNIVKNAMVATVTGGTAASVALPGVQVAAKTGSAQNPAGESHAWLVAFAPAEAPQIAVAVVVENAGYGGVAAAPIAREIMAVALRR